MNSALRKMILKNRGRWEIMTIIQAKVTKKKHKKVFQKDRQALIVTCSAGVGRLLLLSRFSHVEKNSKIPVTQVENQEGKVGVKSATTDIGMHVSFKIMVFSGYMELLL